jgi:hypothetical protein
MKYLLVPQYPDYTFRVMKEDEQGIPLQVECDENRGGFIELDINLRLAMRSLHLALISSGLPLPPVPKFPFATETRTEPRTNEGARSRK